MILASIFLGFLILSCGEVGLKLVNMAMATTMMIDDEDSMALLPFGGSTSSVGRFIRLPQCGVPRRTGTYF